MRRYELPFVVKHVYQHAITFTHLFALNECEARYKVGVQYPGTNVVYARAE